MGMDTSFGSLLVHDSVATLTASDGVTWTDLVLSVALCHLIHMTQELTWAFAQLISD